MKRKNIHFVELHVEKFILALGVVFFLVVVWRYALSDPYVVTMRQDRAVAPAEVEMKVLDALAKLTQKIKPGTPSPLPPMTVPAYTSMFQTRLDQAPLSVGQLDPMGQLGLSITERIRGVDAVVADLPVPPAPVQISVRAGFGVLLSPEKLVDHYAGGLAGSQRMSGSRAQDVANAYGRWVATRQPRDFRYVSVGGWFDALAWRRMRPTNGTIPPEQWEVAMSLADVILERQTFDPVQGRWGADVVVAPLPGAISFRDLDERWTTSRAQQTIQRIKAIQEEIARPPFAPMTDGVKWMPPELADTELSEPEPQETATVIVQPTGGQKVWAHDLTAEPGITYRYRLRVSLINPMFQRSKLKGQRREKYFHKLAILSRASQWTKPVTIEPLRQFFVVGGSGAERQATIEVWRVFDGRPRVSEFRVYPGDPLGHEVTMSAAGQQIVVDMSIPGLVVDLVDAASERGLRGRSIMLYVSADTHQLFERSIEADRASPARARLISQAAVAAGEAQPAVVGTR